MASKKERAPRISANPGDLVFITAFFGKAYAFLEVVFIRRNKVVVEVDGHQVEIPARRAQIVIDSQRPESV